jgi:hypothetical protein
MKIELLIGSFVLLSPICAYQIFKTQVCLYYGRAMASEDMLKIQPNGFQDALTDPKGNKWFFISQIALIANIIGFFYFFSFWMGLLAVITFFIVLTILKKILPAPDSHKWAAGLHGVLARREADYKRDGDELRYQAARDILELFEKTFGIKFFEN